MRTTLALPLFALGLLACSAMAAEADSYSKAAFQHSGIRSLEFT